MCCALPESAPAALWKSRLRVAFAYHFSNPVKTEKGSRGKKEGENEEDGGGGGRKQKSVSKTPLGYIISEL